MRAFEVHLNGKRLCVAGIGDNGVLTAHIAHLVGQYKNELRLEVGGLSLPFKEYVTWNRRKLKVGDEVRITIIETTASDSPETSIDRPKERIQQVEIDPKEEIRNQKRYVREIARKFGWKVVVKRKGS
jgi:hypothetical protein